MSFANSDTLRKELAEAEAREDIQQCIEICRSGMADEMNSDPRNLWYFGIKLAAYLLADQEHPSEKNVDEAIEVMTRMLTVFSREKQPGYWARVHLQLGGAVRDPKEALMHYEKALEVFSRDKHPEEWALARKAAGEVYYYLADSVSELDKSLRYLRQALAVFTPEKYPNEGLTEMISKIENVAAKAKALEKIKR